MSEKERKQPGRKAGRVKVNESWEDAVKKALRRKKPPEGWPDEDDKKREKKPAK